MGCRQGSIHLRRTHGSDQYTPTKRGRFTADWLPSPRLAYDGLDVSIFETGDTPVTDGFAAGDTEGGALLCIARDDAGECSAGVLRVGVCLGATDTGGEATLFIFGIKDAGDTTLPGQRAISET